MLPKSEKACFAIADISGYTKFLASSELEHAQDILAEFTNTVVEALGPTFRLAKPHFSYQMQGGRHEQYSGR